MTLRELLAFFEGYYGEKYSGVFLDVMTGYLSELSPRYYKPIAEVLVKRFTRAYGKAPSPAEVEMHMEEIKGLILMPKYLPEPDLRSAESYGVWEELVNKFKLKIRGGNKHDRNESKKE